MVCHLYLTSMFLVTGPFYDTKMSTDLNMIIYTRRSSEKVVILEYMYEGLWKVMNIHQYNFTQKSERKYEGISVNVRI